jgi:ABC-2 type transport system permease protein
MIGAILWAQFLSMRLRKGGAARGTAVFSVITGLIFYGVFAFFGWALMLVFSSPDFSAQFVQLLSGVLLIMMLYWQLAPVISASFGASIDLRKLMAYPIPRNKLFLVEVLLRTMTSFDMLVVICGICIGLLRNRLYGAAAAPYVISGALAFIAMNVLLSAGIRSLLERFFLRTRFKEVFFVILVLIGITPQLLILANVKKPASLLRFAPSHVVWPWATMARLMLHEGVALSALAAALWVGAALVFSRRQFERSLHFDGTTVRRKEREAAPDSFSERIFRLPSRFLGDPIAALMEKEMRTLSRIARFRMAYGMSCFFGVLVFTPMLRRQHPGSPFLEYALPLMAVYGLLMLGQVTYWNSLGFDRSAVQGYFCWPVRFRDALIAKNLTVMVMLVPQLILVSMVARAFHIPSSPAKILETFVVVSIAALFWFGLGNIMSVRMPRAMDPDKMNQMSNKLQAMTIFAAPFVLLPVVLAYWARSVFSNELVFAGILAIAAILGAIFYGVGLDSAVNSANENRESMLTELSRADGPISIT